MCNIRFCTHYIKKKKVLERVSEMRHAQEARCLLHVTLLHVNRRHSTPVLSDRHKCKDYYYTICLFTRLTIKNCTGTDLVNEEVITPCLLICHRKHSPNKAQNCFWLLLYCFVGGRGRKGAGSLVVGQIFKKQYHSVCCYRCEFKASEKKNGPKLLVALTAHHTPNLTSCRGNTAILEVNISTGYNQAILLKGRRGLALCS
jgi:hypothetical protein